MRRLFALAIVCLGVLSCVERSPTTPSSESPKTTSVPQEAHIEATVPEVAENQGTVVATFQNGTVIRDWATYDAQAGTLVGDASEVTLNADLLPANSHGPSPLAPTVAKPLAGAVVFLGKYVVRISAEGGRLGSCIGRNNFNRHVGFMIRNAVTQSEVVNLHLATWTENGRICFGIYNSATEWCKRFCSPTRSQIQNTLVEAMVAVGISVAMAVVIAKIAVPILIVALAM